MFQGIAAAKVNLALAVLGRRADGYHMLQSVMQTLSLCDIVEVELAAQTSVSCDCPGLATGPANLAYQAWSLMHRELGLDAGVKITLHKQIPLGGGLAGGSADAAQVLLALDQLFELRLTPARLNQLALTLGADVPFCLQGGTALAQGVGEQLQTLPACPELRLVLVNPGWPAATAAVYQQYDQLIAPPAAQQEAAIQKMLEALQEGDPVQISNSLYNALEPPAFALFPQLAAIRQELAGLGLAALLCGSGATVMGIARDKKRAASAAAALQGKYPFVQAVTTKNYL